MKQKKFTHKLRPLFIVAITLIFNQFSYSQIVSYGLTSSMNSTQGTGGPMTTNGLNLSFASSVAQTTNWNAAPLKYWQTGEFSTAGLHTIVVSARIYSTATTGPRDFALEYRIGAGGTWQNATSFQVTSVNTNYQYTLPEACINQSSLYVRWIQSSYTSVSGATVQAAAKSYIKTVQITGLAPIIPTVSANNISIVSVTPTTITIDCSPGDGANRIIVMNTINSFTNPVNDQKFTADTHYNGNGVNPFEQVIYNGVGTKVVVTVPLSRQITIISEFTILTTMVV